MGSCWLGSILRWGSPPPPGQLFEATAWSRPTDPGEGPSMREGLGRGRVMFLELDPNQCDPKPT